MKTYPMHEKMKEHREEARIISEFLDFLSEADVSLAKWNERDQLESASYTDRRFSAKDRVIGAFLEIDPDALSREKDEMYAELDASNKRR